MTLIKIYRKRTHEMLLEVEIIAQVYMVYMSFRRSRSFIYKKRYHIRCQRVACVTVTVWLNNDSKSGEVIPIRSMEPDNLTVDRHIEHLASSVAICIGVTFVG